MDYIRVISFMDRMVSNCTSCALVSVAKPKQCLLESRISSANLSSDGFSPTKSGMGFKV